MIETDGVSCSILLLRKDKVGSKRIMSNKIPKREQYIDELKDFSKLQDKNIVAIDPNQSDLLYCVDNDTIERNHYRYTQNQRRKETKHKKYQNIILEYKDAKIDGKTIIQLETEVSLFNRKTLNIEEFKKYLKKKNEVNSQLFRFYQKELYRKLKLNGYWNRLRSEQRMINRFSKIFGKPTDTIICIGDFEQRKHRKFKEPLKGKGFRTLFRKSGYKVYLVDEFRTSCKCSNCDGGDCNKFRKCRNPKPMKNNSILSHGVLMCKTCSALWNRDENSSRNIYKIAYNAIHQKERPIYLDRSKVVSGTTSVDRLQCHSSLEEPAQPQFTRLETVKPC
jgi:transposase